MLKVVRLNLKSSLSPPAPSAPSDKTSAVARTSSIGSLFSGLTHFYTFYSLAEDEGCD